MVGRLLPGSDDIGKLILRLALGIIVLFHFTALALAFTGGGRFALARRPGRWD